MAKTDAALLKNELFFSALFIRVPDDQQRFPEDLNYVGS
jgi:hypothetical protein